MSGDGLLTKPEAEIEEEARERYDSPRLRAAYYVAQVAAYRSEWVRGATWGVLVTSWLIIGHGTAVWFREKFPGVPWDSGTETALTVALGIILWSLLLGGLWAKWAELTERFSGES
jgi:hypothetical protein